MKVIELLTAKPMFNEQATIEKQLEKAEIEDGVAEQNLIFGLGNIGHLNQSSKQAS